MEQIVNFNTDRKCAEKFCNDDYEYFCEFEFYGMKILLAMCKEHAEQFDVIIAERLQIKYAKSRIFKPIDKIIELNNGNKVIKLKQ